MSLVKKAEEILRSGKYSDVTFLVGHSMEPVKAHRLILVMFSEVFEDMLKNNPTTVPLRDVEPKTFRQLLEHIYTDSLDLVESCQDAFQLYSLAKEFLFIAVADKCIGHLRLNLKISNAIEIYEFSMINEEFQLANSAMEFCCINASTILRHESFMRADLETIKDLFEQQLLNVECEMELIEALHRVMIERNLTKSDIRRAVRNIRFQLVPLQKISSSNAIKDILTSEDVLALLMTKTTSKPVISMTEDLNSSTTPRN